MKKKWWMATHRNKYGEEIQCKIHAETKEIAKITALTANGNFGPLVSLEVIEDPELIAYLDGLMKKEDTP